MYIYGYCSGGIYGYQYGDAEIRDFCKERAYEISEVFCDDNESRLDYIALKKNLQHEDAIIITRLEDLGKDKEEILNELTYLINSDIRIMVLDKPFTLFDFPKSNEEEIKSYMEKVLTVNNTLLQEYAALTQQVIRYGVRHERMAKKITVNGNVVELSLRPKTWNIDKKNSLLIKASRQIVKKESSRSSAPSKYIKK